MIFNENTIWDRKPIAYSDDDIKELDEVIVHIEISKLKVEEMKDIQLVEDIKADESTPIITRQADHEDENLDKNLEESEQQAKDKDD